MQISNISMEIGSFCVDNVGRNKKIIEEYIKNQMQEDLAYKQISLKEYIDPFTGEPVKKAKNKPPFRCSQ